MTLGEGSKMRRVTLSALLLVLVVGGCISVERPSVLLQDEREELLVYGLTTEEVCSLGPEGWVVLSLLRSKAVDVLQARALGRILDEPTAAKDMPEYPVHAETGMADLGTFMIPIPSDHPADPPDPGSRPVWRRQVYGPERDLTGLPPGPSYDWPGSPLGPFPYTEANSSHIRGACWKLVSRPGQWRIAAAVTIPDLEAIDPAFAYVYFGLEAPGARAVGGLVFSSEDQCWEVFLWDGTNADGDDWLQAQLERTLSAGDRVLVVFGLSENPNEYELRLWDLENLRSLGLYRDDLWPTGETLDRDNLALQVTCVASLTSADPETALSSQVQLTGLRLQSLSTLGWSVSPTQDLTVRWEHVTSDNSFGSSSHPDEVFEESGALPSLQLSVGRKGRPGDG